MASATDHEPETTLQLSLYPNPASTVLNLRLSGIAKLALVKINDMRGVVILTIRNPGNNQVDISSLAAGVYIATVSVGKQEYHQKFIKQ